MVKSRSRPRQRPGASGSRSPGPTSDAAPAPAAAAKAAEPEKPHVTTHFEFGGPIGASANLVFLPVFTWVMAVANRGAQWPDLTWRPSMQELADSFDPTAFAVVAGWLVFHGILYYLAPGKWVSGTTLANGKKLEYPINAFSSLIITILALTGLHFYVVPITWLAHNYVQVATAAIVLSSALALYLYASSFAPGATLARGGNSGNALYDAFMGRELNPRLFGNTFDLKFFCELRPGLIGWAVLNVALALQQAEAQGQVTNSMILVLAFQAYYVLDALWFEHCILTTVDITTDGFGFMLAFGDLAWVPFTYTLQARFLAANPLVLSEVAVGCILALKALGLYIFRSANLQKDTFRSTPTAPEVKDLAFIQTKRGTRLLAAGWWGMARHINYLGDWIMGVAWCLPCGFASPIPYFYAVYFAILLIHRERRDDHKCAEKYGADWDEYKARVPWRIVPGVY